MWLIAAKETGANKNKSIRYTFKGFEFGLPNYSTNRKEAVKFNTKKEAADFCKRKGISRVTILKED